MKAVRRDAKVLYLPALAPETDIEIAATQNTERSAAGATLARVAIDIRM